MKKKVKTKTIETLIIPVGKKHHKTLLKKGIAKLGEEQIKELKKIIDKRLKECYHHFKVDGWDLDFDCIESEIIMDFLGFDLSWYLMSRFVDAGEYKIEYKERDTSLGKRFYIGRKNGKNNRSALSKRKRTSNNSKRRATKKAT